jgi:hypothetical protein
MCSGPCCTSESWITQGVRSLKGAWIVGTWPGGIWLEYVLKRVWRSPVLKLQCRSRNWMFRRKVVFTRGQFALNIEAWWRCMSRDWVSGGRY